MSVQSIAAAGAGVGVAAAVGVGVGLVLAAETTVGGVRIAAASCAIAALPAGVACDSGMMAMTARPNTTAARIFKRMNYPSLAPSVPWPSPRDMTIFAHHQRPGLSYPRRRETPRMGGG